MNQSGLKNMVVLKNLPSNLIEEAIIVLKSNMNVKQIEKIDKNKVKERDYIQKEAEMLICNYIRRLEDRKKEKIENKKQENKKYMKLKKYSIIATVLLVIEAILLIIK